MVEIISDEGASGQGLGSAGAPARAEADRRRARGRQARPALEKRVAFGTLLEWFEEQKAVLVALDLQIDTSTPGGKLVANVFAAVAEWERGVIGEWKRLALGALRADGRAVSRPAVVDDAALADRIRSLRAAGMTRQAICDVLNAEGVPTARGAAMWRPSSLQAVEAYVRPTRRRRADLPALGRRRPA